MSRLYGSVWDARSALLHRGGKVPHEHPSQSLRPVVSTALSQTTIQPHNVHQLRSSPKVSFSWSAANQTRLNPHTFATDFRSSSSGNYEFIQPSFQFKNLTSNNISFYDESKNVGANEESGGDEWSWQSSFPTGEHSIGTSQLSGTSLLPSTPPTFVSSSPLFHSQTGVPSPCLPGQVMSLTTWMSHYRDNGVLVEYVHNHARQLGLLDGPSTERVGYWRIQTKLHEGETETLLVPATRVTFQWPQRHLNTIYCYRLDDIPHLLLMCQELSEKFRPQVAIAWGAFVDKGQTTVYPHILAQFLCGPIPKPHEIYVAHRLLVESTVYFAPSDSDKDSPLASLTFTCQPAHLVKTALKQLTNTEKTEFSALSTTSSHSISSSSTTTTTTSSSSSSSSSSNTTFLLPAPHLFIQRLFHRLCQLNNTKTKNCGISSLLNRAFVSSPMLTLPSRQLTGNENERENEEEMKTIVSIAQHTEWNPAADRVYIDALKQYVLDKDNSRSVGKRTSVYRTLIHPLCRLLGVPTTPLHVFNVLVQLGIWSKYENLHVLRFPWRLDFTLQELQRCAELAAQFGHSPTSASSSSSSLLQSNGSISTTVGGMNSVSVCVDRDRAHRVDLRTVCPLVFSIDAHTDQCEVDDAVSLEVREHNELWIWVHIADPSRCVAPNSELDLLARSRVASVYLPERPPATMFPPPLPQHTFSLLPHEDNYALSFAIHLNSEGRVEEYDIVPSIIPHVRPLTYDELDQALPYNNNNNNKKLSSSSVTTLLSPEEERVLCTLRDLCELRRRWRIQHGALVSDWPRAEIRVLNEGSQIEVRTVCDSTSWSRRMVTELMILVGDVTADFAIAHHIPIPFRSSVVGQQSPESSLITKKSPSWIDFINTPKYTYSVTPSGPHSALALPSYTQATSPIRRYHDLLVHHQIKAHLRGESPPFTVDKLSALVCELEPRVQAIHRLIHYSHRYWLLRYLERQPPDRRYSAKVLHVAPSEETSPSHSVVVHALLLDFGLKVTVRLSRPVAVDDIITLQLQHVDAFHNQITFVEELHS